VNELMAELIEELRKRGVEMRRGRGEPPTSQESFAELLKVLETYRPRIMQQLHAVIHASATEPEVN
jgi:hypothetical protein